MDALTFLLAQAAFATVVAVATLATMAAPAPGSPAWLWAPPWRDAALLAARADAWAVGPVPPRIGLVVHDGGAGGGTLAARLRGEGAWIVLDAAVLAQLGCLPDADSLAR